MALSSVGRSPAGSEGAVVLACVTRAKSVHVRYTSVLRENISMHFLRVEEQQPAVGIGPPALQLRESGVFGNS